MKPKQRAISLLSKTELGREIAEDQHSRLLLSAAISFGCNLGYAVYHGILGAIHLSLWFFVMCAFYGILAVMRFCAVLCGHMGRDRDAAPSEYFVMRMSGILLLLLSLVLGSVIYISLSQNIATAYGKITMITIAAYTFYKITAVAVRAFRQRRDFSPVFGVIRNVSYAEAAASLLTLQRSMLVSFGAMEREKICMMNALTGAAVCLFVLVLGILLIIKSRKEMKLCQNRNW